MFDKNSLPYKESLKEIPENIISYLGVQFDLNTEKRIYFLKGYETANNRALLEDLRTNECG